MSTMVMALLCLAKFQSRVLERTSVIMSIFLPKRSNYVQSSLLIFPIAPVFQEKPSLDRYIFMAL